MNELQRTLKQAMREATDVDEELALQEFNPLAKNADPLHKLPKMLFTQQEAAWVTSLSVSTLYRLVKAGQLKVTRIRGNIRIRREDIVKLVKDNLI